MSRKQNTILLVHESLTIASAIELLLTKYRFRVVAIAHDLKSAVVKAKSQAPTLSLVEVSSTKNCFDAGSKIKQAAPGTKLVYFGDRIREGLVSQALENGGSGVLLSSLSAEMFIDGLREIIDGKIYLSPGLEVRRSLPSRRNGLARLTPKQLEVLKYFAQDYSVRETAEAMQLAISTIAAHHRTIRSKLKVRGEAGMALFAAREGLVQL